MTIDKNNVNTAALKFFLDMVEEARVRVCYYNGEHKLYGQCVKMEHHSRTYMNQVLQQMRDAGFENVPPNIPERVYKKKKAEDVLKTE